jgi:DNA repair ATPase RecN
VECIEDGWDSTKEKATSRLQFLQKTKAAWEGYAEGLETIAQEFEKADEEMKKVKKRFNLESAKEDLAKRQDILNESRSKIESLYKSIQDNYEVMTMTLPDEKKDFIKKEVKAITDKLQCVTKFDEKVKKIENFVNNLSEFDDSLKSLDKWMLDAEKQLNDIKETSDQLTPEDRVSYTMELQENIGEKVKTFLYFITFYTSFYITFYNLKRSRSLRRTLRRRKLFFPKVNQHVQYKIIVLHINKNLLLM